MTEEIKQKAEHYMRDFHNTELSETDLILFAEQLISETTKELQTRLAISEHDREHNDYELAEAYEKIADLEKENESLENIKNIYIGDLLKTKEMLKMVINSYNYKEKFSFEKDLAKAESFLIFTMGKQEKLKCKDFVRSKNENEV